MKQDIASSFQIAKPPKGLTPEMVADVLLVAISGLYNDLRDSDADIEDALVEVVQFALMSSAVHSGVCQYVRRAKVKKEYLDWIATQMSRVSDVAETIVEADR